MEEEFFLAWLVSNIGMTAKRQEILLNQFGTAEEIFRSPKELLLCVDNISKNIMENLLNNRSEKKFLLLKKFMIKNKIRYIHKNSEEFPMLLKNISDPPLGFFIIGKLPNDHDTKVAIIGSRKYSEYGAKITRNLSYDLSKNKLIIVSGMARGIDSIAHESAVEANSDTIAVLGCGVDICYPPENFKLRDKIINNGCIISEFALGTKPLVGNFPIRNRIISGLSKGVIVTEASNKSGTMITVAHALEQGREVMAVPGEVTSGFSIGTNYLIKQGAVLVRNFQDVFDILKIDKSNDFKDNDNNKYNNSDKNNFFIDKKENFKKKLNLSDDEKNIYDLLGVEARDFDYISIRTTLPTSVLISTLIILEIKNLIKKLPGQKYVKNQ
ncbi:MAG: DNA-processing protein DprA [Clostridiales bacterium]|jgi:DNA processing protein|nr:DNA-processing protein DprA [Clostridiales bacterium]